GRGLCQPAAQEARPRYHQDHSRCRIQGRVKGRGMKMRGWLAMPSSVTARLILGLTLGTTLLWCGAVAYSGYTSYRELGEAFDRGLQESAQHLLPLAADSVDAGGGRAAHEIHHFIEGRNEYLSFQLRDSAGRIVMRSRDAPATPYSQMPSPGFSTVGDYR